MRDEGNITSSAFFSMSESPVSSSSADGQTAAPADNKILICSRDFDTRLLLKTILELWGFQPQMSDCPEQTNSIIKADTPSLILLDSVLPFAEHLENIRQIRRRKVSRNIPIIVISGFSQTPFKKLSFDAGANDVLVKPLDFDLLESYLKRFIIMPDNKAL